MTVWRAVRWALGLLAAGVLLVVGVVLLVPDFLDAPVLHKALEERASREVRGNVSWDSIRIRVLPSPRAVVRGARIEIPGRLQGTIQRAAVELWGAPLLALRAEVRSIELERPRFSLELPPILLPVPRTPADATALYLRFARPIGAATERLPPRMTLTVANGELHVHKPNLFRFTAWDFDLRLRTENRTAALEASAAGDYWDKVAVDASVRLDDRSSSLAIAASGLRLQNILDKALARAGPKAQVPRLDASVRLANDGATALDLALAADAPSATVQRARARFSPGRVAFRAVGRIRGDDLEVAVPALEIGELVPSARGGLHVGSRYGEPRAYVEMPSLALVPLSRAALALAGDVALVRKYAGRVRGGQLSDIRVYGEAPSWAGLAAPRAIAGRAVLEGASVRLPEIDATARAIGARVELSEGVLRVEGAAGRALSSRWSDTTVRYSLAERRLDARGRFDVELSGALQALRRVLRNHEPEMLAKVQSVAGRVQGTAKARLALRGTPTLAYDVTLTPRALRAGIEGLPAPAGAEGGSLRFTPAAITAHGVALSLLDARAVVSGGFSAARGRIEATVADGAAGHESLAWLFDALELPARLQPKPFTFAASRVAWDEAGLEVAASADFPAGASVAVEAAANGEGVQLRRAHVKDAESDAEVSLASGGGAIEAAFSGRLALGSVQSLLAQASRELRGRVAGALRVSMRADAPLESTGRGRLSGEALDLEGLTSLPLRVERVDIEADGPAWRVHDLAVDWAGQKATARGVLAWQGAGPVINAEIQSPGIVLDAFLPPKEKRREEPALKSVSRQLASPPLKVTGNVLLRAGYVAFRRMRVQPLQATLELRPEGGALRLEQASVCGIAFPLQANFGAAGIEARVKLTAKNASLEETSRCLGDKNLSITGQFDLAADLGVKSKWDGIVAALEGPLELHAENGEIRKFAMLGNILALKNVRDAMKQDLRLDAEGFRYRDIDVKARFGRGKLAIEDAWLDSNAIGLAAYGTLELDDLTARITALVAPFSRIDRFVRSVPLFGYVIGGTLTSIPVGVNGDIREPLVVPLGPVAVTKQLFGVFERAVKLPFKVVGDLTNEAPEDGSLQKR